MAYPLAPGMASIDGNFAPHIFSDVFNVEYFMATCLYEITNNTYEGEITQKGSKVIIRTLPDIDVTDDNDGEEINYQHLAGGTIELLIDKGKRFGFMMTDREMAQMDVDAVSALAQKATLKTSIAIDKSVLGSIYADSAAANTGLTAGAESAYYNMGIAGTPLTVDETNIVKAIVNMGAILDEQHVPREDRWLIVPPSVRALIANSEMKNVYVTGDAESTLRNGKVGNIDDFELYVSSNLATATENGKTAFYMPFGHRSAVTFASQLAVLETLRLPNVYGTAVRGLQVYGFKTVKPEGLGTCYAVAG